MIKIVGIEALTKTLDDAQKALAEIDGELGSVAFDPGNPASIESAIRHAEAIIDGRLGAYASNPIVAPLIEGMKERYRQGVIDRAAKARLQGEENGE